MPITVVSRRLGPATISITLAEAPADDGPAIVVIELPDLVELVDQRGTPSVNHGDPVEVARSRGVAPLPFRERARAGRVRVTPGAVP